MCTACGTRCHRDCADAGDDDDGNDGVGIAASGAGGSWTCHRCNEAGVVGDAHALLTLAGGAAAVVAGSPHVSLPATPPRSDVRLAPALQAGDVDPSTQLTFAEYSALWAAQLLDSASNLLVGLRFRDATLRLLPALPAHAAPSGADAGSGAGGGAGGLTSAAGGAVSAESSAVGGAGAVRRLALLWQLARQLGLRPSFSSYRRHLTDSAWNSVKSSTARRGRGGEAAATNVYRVLERMVQAGWASVSVSHADGHTATAVNGGDAATCTTLRALIHTPQQANVVAQFGRMILQVGIVDATWSVSTSRAFIYPIVGIAADAGGLVVPIAFFFHMFPPHMVGEAGDGQQWAFDTLHRQYGVPRFSVMFFDNDEKSYNAVARSGAAAWAADAALPEDASVLRRLRAALSVAREGVTAAETAAASALVSAYPAATLERAIGPMELPSRVSFCGAPVWPSTPTLLSLIYLYNYSS